jgi:ubiquinone/menaquinone biosynthesis C-methylase UbiE
MKIRLISLLVLPLSLLGDLSPLKEYEKMWEFRSKDKKNVEEFAAWWGTESAISRILARIHIVHKEYKSVLDIPCGLCTDYDALKRSCPDMHYVGIDISNAFVDKAKEKGIPALLGRIQESPCSDSAFDVVYSRHILEHLENYQDAIKEMVRVAKKEVLIVFFIAPDKSATDRSNVISVGGYFTYQNRYSKAKIEAFLGSLEKVKSFSWQEVKNKEECILHIMVS